jgi:hypothetical protein
LGTMFSHGGLTSSVKLIESSNGFFSPHNLGSKKCNLCTIVFEPLVSLSI